MLDILTKIQSKILTFLRFFVANFMAAVKRAQLSEKVFWGRDHAGCDVIHSTHLLGHIVSCNLFKSFGQYKSQIWLKIQTKNYAMCKGAVT